MMLKTSLGAGDLFQRAQKYVGLPYSVHGRTEAGVDCYGLFRLFYQNEFGITLPDFDYSNCTTAEHARIIQQSMQAVVLPIAEQEALPGDAILMRYGNSIAHVALYLGYDTILHASCMHNARISRLTDMEGIRTLKTRIAGWYRCRFT